jgi:hypothetical protein
MNNNHPHLAIGQEVTFVGHDKKTHNGKITQVYGPESAHIELENGSGIADFSDKKEPGTFHFEQASPKAEQPTEAKKHKE